MELRDIKTGSTVLLLIIVLSAFLFLCGCGGGQSDSNGDNTESGAMKFNIVLHYTGSGQYASPAEFDCGIVYSVEAYVYNQKGTLLASGGPWWCGGGEGNISSVPAGNNRSVVVIGRDIDENIIFRGENPSVNVIAGQKNDAGTINCNFFVPEPELPADGDEVEAGDIQFSWPAITGAQQYVIRVSENDDLANPLVDETIMETTFTFSTLSDGQTLYWQVFAYDRYSNRGKGSRVYSLVTDRTVFLKDINQGRDSSSPSDFISFGNYLFFTASEGTVYGRTLWRSDGTKSGTVKIEGVQGVSNLTLSGSSLYFTANITGYGNELCRMDDWQNNAFSVIDVMQGTDSSYPNNITEAGGYIYFSSMDGSNQRLKFYDPSTNQITTINTSSVALSSINNIDVVGDQVYFSAADAGGFRGVELWITGAGDDDAVFLEDINDGGSGSYPANFKRLGYRAIFVANDGVSGYELWRSNGTPTSTIQLKNICPEGASSNIVGLTVYNDLVYFFADDTDDGTLNRHLWRTDGTQGGTYPVETSTGQRIPAGGNGSYMVVMGNELYFRSADSTSGDELRRSDGTVAGTFLVKNIWPGATGSYSRNPDMWDFIYSIDGMVYFRATDETFGENAGEVWVTDGTPDGTHVIDINPGSGTSYPERIGEANGSIFISAYDETHGWELWKYVP